MIRWIADRLASRLGMELHFPPRPDPPLEPAGTLRNDGTPCSPPPAGGRVPTRSRPTTYRAGR